MSDSNDDNASLRHHVFDHFQQNQHLWKRLQAYIESASELSQDEHSEIVELKQEKPFLRRLIRKHLARLRRRYRKDYRVAAEDTLTEWRPEYNRRLAKARPYQRDISRLMKREIRWLQTAHTTIKKLNVMCDALRDRITRKKTWRK